MADEKDGLWVVLARVEDETSPYAKLGKPLITRQMIRDVVKSYDPAFRRASIVAAEKGSVHAARGIPAVAYIDKLDTDGLNLMGRIEADSVGEFSDRVCRGWRGRSVEIYPRMPGIDGEPPYLLRVGLLSSEQPGIPNLPDLKEYIRDLPTEGVALITRELADPVTPAPAPTEEMHMTPEDIQAIADKVTASMEPKNAALTEKLTALEAKLTEKTAELERSGEKVLEALKERDAKDRGAKYDEAVDSLCREMRLPPGEAASEKEILRALPDAIADKRIETLRARRQMTSRPGLEQTLVGLDGTEVVISREFTDPHGNFGGNPEAIRAVEKCKQEANGNAELFRQKLLALPPQLTAN
jgi:hypothetical protein